MERGMRELEEEVNMLKSNGALSSEEREEEIKQMEVYRSHSKFMKNKVKDTHTHRLGIQYIFFFLHLLVQLKHICLFSLL